MPRLIPFSGAWGGRSTMCCSMRRMHSTGLRERSRGLMLWINRLPTRQRNPTHNRWTAIQSGILTYCSCWKLLATASSDSNPSPAIDITTAASSPSILNTQARNAQAHSTTTHTNTPGHATSEGFVVAIREPKFPTENGNQKRPTLELDNRSDNAAVAKVDLHRHFHLQHRASSVQEVRAPCVILFTMSVCVVMSNFDSFSL
jgi:hypothetical protein